MQTREGNGGSIFVRILLVFRAVTIATNAVLILIAYLSNSRLIETRAKESIFQQVGSMHDHFENNYSSTLRSTLRGLADSSALEDYLLTPNAEKILVVQKVERLFVQAMKDSPQLQVIRFADSGGDVRISVSEKRRSRESLNLKTAANA